ncbi:hypothetical protein ACIREE_39105 [Streptomyces sp. NPDC102467]|uniref:hypothetical protein n=1 Tax=Streptomyces sp. NPDC102467 TaxID=3366179 RepID=UPI003812C587
MSAAVQPPYTTRHIVVGVDSSEVSVTALRRAARQPSALGPHVAAVLAREPPPGGLAPDAPPGASPARCGWRSVRAATSPPGMRMAAREIPLVFGALPGELPFCGHELVSGHPPQPPWQRG